MVYIKYYRHHTQFYSLTFTVWYPLTNEVTFSTALLVVPGAITLFDTF